MMPPQNRPMLLSSQVTLLPGATKEAPEVRMVNPLNTAMLIDEIRFKTPPISASGLGISAYNPLLNIRCALRMGRVALTNNPVPIGNFGRVTLEDTSTGTVGGVGNYVNSLGSPQAFITTHSTWKLPKPLYVPRGEFLVPKITYDTRFLKTLTSFNPSQFDSLTIDVSFAGRSLPPNFPVPKSIAVPWVTSFDVDLLALTAGNSDTTISNQTQLVNPFDKPMFVQRFIGRSLLHGNGEEASLYAPFELGDGFPGSAAAWTMTTVRAVDSLNNILVRDPTPFGHLFQFLSRSWNVNAHLPSQGFYIMTVDRNYTSTIASTYLAHAISMVGYREVELQ